MWSNEVYEELLYLGADYAARFSTAAPSAMDGMLDGRSLAGGGLRAQVLAKMRALNQILAALRL